MGTVNDQRRKMGLPTIGSAENVAMIVAAALDQLRKDARRAGLVVLVEKLDAAFQQAVEDCKTKTEEEACLSEQ
jgi:hypothetical protein